ncbi:MAG: trypsin-like peptidase domain-containing protein [Verrucomicrobiae bacterium]|nr:trypsin-like peptidase domain-containing protein [Verrucomicrobiae bacterium]
MLVVQPMVGAAGTAVSLADLKSVEHQVQQALPRARDATVVVSGGGSGVIVTPDGYVLCAEHVVGRPGRRALLTLDDGRHVAAETLGSTRFADAGMLKIIEPGEWPFAPMAENGSSVAGDWCFVLGHSSGYDAVRGPVVRVGRVIVKGRNVIQTDCQLIGGDSGGPLFNLAGEVIGINSRIADELDENYHAPVEAVQRFWEPLLAGETIPRQDGRGGGWLGIRTSTHPDGLLIDSVAPGSAAAQASLEPGWIILRVDDYAVGSPDELGIAVGAHAPGEEVTLRYRQAEAERSVKVELGERPRRRRPRGP